MVAALRHRGPDAVGFHVAGRVALGVARLRVIDLETGDQPIASEDGAVTAILNGEIYDFAARRRELEARGHRFRSNSDTEVLVARLAGAWRALPRRPERHVRARAVGRAGRAAVPGA